jgi:hypothetical protein
MALFVLLGPRTPAGSIMQTHRVLVSILPSMSSGKRRKGLIGVCGERFFALH